MEILNSTLPMWGGGLERRIIDLIYPLGSLFISTSNINPGTLFEGTQWEPYAEGRAIVGVGGNYQNSRQEFGSDSVSLTTQNLAAHNHTFSGQSATTSNSGGHIHQCGTNNNGNFVVNPSTSTSSTFGYQVATGGAYLGFQYGTNSAGAHTHTLTAKGTISNTGSGTAHENRQPSITCYIWERIA